MISDNITSQFNNFEREFFKKYWCLSAMTDEQFKNDMIFYGSAKTSNGSRLNEWCYYLCKRLGYLK
jgi:hypothetical protein